MIIDKIIFEKFGLMDFVAETIEHEIQLGAILTVDEKGRAMLERKLENNPKFCAVTTHLSNQKELDYANHCFGTADA